MTEIGQGMGKQPFYRSNLSDPKLTDRGNVACHCEATGKTVAV